MKFDYKKLVNEIAATSDDFHSVSDEEREKLQKCLYEMACDIDARCRGNDIKLFLVGGSLLGAIRHKGFIPWDDDMDFGINRADYEKLKDIFEEQFSDCYQLRCPNTDHPNGNRFMQIFKKGTVLESLGDTNPLKPNEVFIDIFPYDYVPQRKLLQKIKGIRANGLMAIASCVMSYRYPDELLNKHMRESSDGRKMYIIRSFIGKVFNFKSPQNWFSKVDNSIKYKRSTGLVTSATGRKHYFGEMFQKDVFFPLVELKFKEHYFYAPNNASEYLKRLYGEDYMNPPKSSERESHFISRLEI